MSEQSSIGWTDSTWPIVVGCDRVSSGCAACYAIREARRLGANPNPQVSSVYAGLVERQPNGQLDWTGLVRCLPERLDWPLRWTRPRRIFVPSLGDLFHEDVPDDFIDQVFAIMRRTRRHTYQVLTKRPARMADYLRTPGRAAAITALAAARTPAGWPMPTVWPLPNVWLGTSVEDQRTAQARLPALATIRAPVRFVSFEPLLGPIDLHPWLGSGRFYTPIGAFTEPLVYDGASFEWAIIGGESGPQARPMDPEWARDLMRQCRSRGVAVFVKQLGGAFAKANGMTGKADDPDQWPADLRVRAWPRVE